MIVHRWMIGTSWLADVVIQVALRSEVKKHLKVSWNEHGYIYMGMTVCAWRCERKRPAGLPEAFCVTRPLEFVQDLSGVSALQFPFPSVTCLVNNAQCYGIIFLAKNHFFSLYLLNFPILFFRWIRSAQLCLQPRYFLLQVFNKLLLRYNLCRAFKEM